MRLTQARLLLSAITLVLGFWGLRSHVARLVCAYASSIFVMMIAWAILGAATIGRIRPKTDYGSLVGVLLGFAIGIGTGVVLGGKAVHSSWLYWVFILAVVVIFVTIPF